MIQFILKHQSASCFFLVLSRKDMPYHMKKSSLKLLLLSFWYFFAKNKSFGLAATVPAHFGNGKLFSVTFRQKSFLSAVHFLSLLQKCNKISQMERSRLCTPRHLMGLPPNVSQKLIKQDQMFLKRTYYRNNSRDQLFQNQNKLQM